MDAQGNVIATTGNKKDGGYEFVLEQPCKGCTVKVERMGFVTQSRSELITTDQTRCGLVLR
jgi:hypothetical protein